MLAISRIVAGTRSDFKAQDASEVERLGKAFEAVDEKLAEAEGEFADARDELEEAKAEFDRLTAEVSSKQSTMDRLAAEAERANNDYIDAYNAAVDAGEDDLYEVHIYSDYIDNL